MKKILYIHGFASDGNSSKSKILKEHFGEENVISPTLPVEPDKAIGLLKNIIISNNYNILPIGTSLGGFYSWYLCQNFEIKGILINPVIYPERLIKYIGKNINHSTQEEFIFKEEYIQELINYKNSIKDITYSILSLFLSTNDEVLCHLDHTLAEYKFSNIRLFDDNHRFDNFKDTLEIINSML